MKKVMVFGVFDGIHGGHRDFLRQAKECGDYLIAVVAQDHVVEHLKGALPSKNLEERFEHLRNEDAVDLVVVGDHEQGIWEVVKRHKPDVIAVGFDQQVLKDDLEKALPNLGYRPEIIMMAVHEAEEESRNL